MKKSEVSPEAWDRYKAKAKEWYHNNRDRVIERTKAYNKTEKATARRRAYDMKPEVKARRQAREAIMRENGYEKEKWAKIKADPALLAKHRAGIRKHRTGMSQELFDHLWQAQSASCAVCKKVFDGPVKGERKARGKCYPCADHCHDSGQPRGLLCQGCNTIEGHIRKSGLTPNEFLDRLHDYLSNPPAKLTTLPSIPLR